jgi:hypothetical protein
VRRKFTANLESRCKVRFAAESFYGASLLRLLTPVHAADFSTRMRSPTATAAASTVDAFSISATSADPTTAASAIPPRTVT